MDCIPACLKLILKSIERNQPFVCSGPEVKLSHSEYSPTSASPTDGNHLMLECILNEILMNICTFFHNITLHTLYNNHVFSTGKLVQF